MLADYFLTLIIDALFADYKKQTKQAQNNKNTLKGKG